MKQLTLHQVKKLFGGFGYKEASGGAIKIDSHWVKHNIVRVELPIIKKVWCNKKIYFDLFRIFYHIQREGMTHKINVADFQRSGGCYVPRHMCWDKKRGLSRHSWGVAIDINPSTNQYGTPGTLDKIVIEIFAKYGFHWGGNWRTPDPMHFEIGGDWEEFKPMLKLFEKSYGRRKRLP